MDTKLRISGFKCFHDNEFLLKKACLLTGNNGAGKSSLIQALLLARLSIEKNLRHHKNKDYLLTNKWNDLLIPLNDGFCLKLGTIYDIIRDKDNEQNQIIIVLDNETFTFAIPENVLENTSIKVSYKKERVSSNYKPFWRKKEFYYLNTERLGPKHSLAVNSTDFIHCGYQGEYTAQVLAKIEQRVDFTSAMIFSSKIKLDQELNSWLGRICPGVTITSSLLGDLNAQIKVSGSSGKSSMLATNIGFGISYVLPIIVTGLIAQKNAIFIVENPEAHLHPKGQSNIGYFLGKVADAGVKVIVETHSEHVVNGLRRAALDSTSLNPNDVNIYFFNGFDDEKMVKIDLIELEDEGSLNKFPKDFFDQVNQDMAEIFKLRNARKNG